MSRDIAWRGADGQPDRGELASDEARIRQRLDTYREIETFIDQIDHAVAQQKLDGNLGKARGEVGYRRRQLQHPEGRRGIDAQLSARSRLQVAGGLLGFLEIGQDPRAALIIGAADFREAKLAGGAVQQARPKPLLQRLDVLADHAGGVMKPRRSAGKASALHHLGEDPHALEAVHGIL